jgi:hypothetical protein
MTWAQTPMDVFPAGITSASDFFVKLAAHITAYSTYWQTSVLDSAGTKRYYEIKRKGTPAAVIANARIFLCSDAASGPPNANVIGPHNSTTNPGNVVFGSFAPNVGGTFPNTGLDTKWLSGLPYAGDANNGGLGGYVRCSHRMGVDHVMDAMWIIENEDCLYVVTMRRSDQLTSVFGMGGIFQAPTVGLGDPVRGDEVVWGVMTTGYWYLHNEVNMHYSHASSTAQSRSAGFVNGQLCDSGERYRQGMIWAINPTSRTITTGSPIRVLRIYGVHDFGNEVSAINNGNWNTSEYPTGAKAGDPVSYSKVDGGSRFRLGSLRQIRAFHGGLSRRAIANDVGSVKGFLLAPYLTFDDNHALLFSQEANPGVG